MTAVPQFQHRTSAKKRVEDDLTQHQPRSQPQTQSFILSRLSRHLITLTVLPLILLGGCYGAPPRPVPPESEEERFAGLDISLDSSGPEHVLIVRTPTAGYICTIDYIADAFGGKDVYLLIKEPNALYVHSTTNHPARLSTGLPRETFIRVLAQQVPHNVKVEREGYRVVTLTARPN